MRAATWSLLGLVGATLLVSMEGLAGSEEPGGAKRNGARPVLEVMSPDPGDCSLGLSWRWGSMAVKRVRFDDHGGAFTASVESTGQGVRVIFDGWGEEPFIASADGQVRVVFRARDKQWIDFTAEAGRAGGVRVRREAGEAKEGKRIVIRLGEGEPRVSAIEATK